MSGNDAGDGRGDGRQQKPDEDLSTRLKRLERRIEEKRPAASSGPLPRPGASSGASPLGQAMRLSTEFIAGVLAGGILGWLCDQFLGTKPWGLIVLLMLGFATGVYNVMRVSGSLPGSARKIVVEKSADKNDQDRERS
ncbi:AtpZ/AtpI family protein [Methylobacterium sp. 77]|uniref:AtpZ/AtpI family protein n=1 Tax=Methylobacterium sp. 77 TaxID=1101192 RepID=UPI0006888D78|nr:AtpZ/AtpI family protein [Methylobacterium sp. 77]